MKDQEYDKIMADHPGLEEEVIRRMRERDAKKNDLFPLNIMVGYDTTKHPDPMGEQYGPYAVTCHPSILKAVGGEAIMVIFYNRSVNRHLKLMLKPIYGSQVMETVGDLQFMAKEIWPSARPMNKKDWEMLLDVENLYTALNDLKKMFPSLDLPDIRSVGHYIDTDDPDCREICRVDRLDREKSISRIPITEMGEENFILCVTDM